jgi:hypothetical protein
MHAVEAVVIREIWFWQVFRACNMRSVVLHLLNMVDFLLRSLSYDSAYSIQSIAMQVNLFSIPCYKGVHRKALEVTFLLRHVVSSIYIFLTIVLTFQ